MGYTTQFKGEFSISPELNLDHYNYLVAFSDARRMKKDVLKLGMLSDPLREAVGLPVGKEGCYSIIEPLESIKDYNKPPKGQPGLYCDWIPEENLKELIYNGSDNFYNYIEWLEYLIEHFFEPWGYVLNGNVSWRGEDFDDVGEIVVRDNLVTAKKFNEKLIKKQPFNMNGVTETFKLLEGKTIKSVEILGINCVLLEMEDGELFMVESEAKASIGGIPGMEVSKTSCSNLNCKLPLS